MRIALPGKIFTYKNYLIFIINWTNSKTLIYLPKNLTQHNMFPSFFNRKTKEYYLIQGDSLLSNGPAVKAVNNIPRFVSSGAYASLFGDQWKQYKKTQLDSYSGTTISKDRLDRCLGDLKDNLAGKTVLEAGCGAGRFTEVLLQKGAYLVSSDL